MALGAHVAASNPRGRLPHHRRARRCRIRRQRDAARTLYRFHCPTRSVISSTLSVFRRTLSVAFPARRARSAAVTASAARRQSPKWAHRRRLPPRASRMRHWRNGRESTLDSPLHRAACHARPRSAAVVDRARTSGCSCERDLGAHPASRHYLVALPATTSLRRPGALGASPLGYRAAVPRIQRRARARSLRGPLLRRLASPCRADRHGLYLAAGRTATRRCPPPTLPIARAVITQILTAHFFVTRPHYLRTMQKLAEINLRI